MDDLIDRLRERAADPKRRTDTPQSISFSGPGGTARESRAMIAAMNPEERATTGLPEVGWEQVEKER